MKAILLVLMFFQGVVVADDSLLLHRTHEKQSVLFSRDSTIFNRQLPGATFWNPTDDDLKSAERVLELFLKAQKPAIYDKLLGYNRQYKGYIRDGKKMIYGNFFPKTERFQNWKTTEIFVLDGGNNYFQIHVDVEDKKIKQIVVNGEA